MTNKTPLPHFSELWSACGATVRGAAHEYSGQKNQDSFMIDRRRDGSIFIALSDGHGNHRSFRSDRGSALAVQVALQQLSRFTAEVPKDFTLDRVRRYARQHLPTFFLKTWQNRVAQDLMEDPITAVEFAQFAEQVPTAEEGRTLSPPAAITYGATLLAIAVTPQYILICQLGDGDILTVSPSGNVTRPLKYDPQIQGNATTSLCTINCEGSFRFAIRPPDTTELSLIMMSTDGYANSYSSDKEFRTVAGDLLTYFRQGGDDLVNEHLETWLRHASRHGSGDDITAAVVARTGLEKLLFEARSQELAATGQNGAATEEIRPKKDEAPNQEPNNPLPEPVVFDQPAFAEPVIAEQPYVAEHPVLAEQPVVAEPPTVVEQPVAEHPVVAEQPSVAEQPIVAEQPVVAEHQPLEEKLLADEKPIEPVEEQHDESHRHHHLPLEEGPVSVEKPIEQQETLKPMDNQEKSPEQPVPVQPLIDQPK